ncbi:MAG TPA: ABC transporter permease [Opitutaceae bacterium]
MRRFLQKLRHMAGRGERLRRLEAEIQTHLDLMTDEGVRQGLSPVEARRRAHLAFGNVLATREKTEEALGWPALESLGHDLRIAARSLLRRPAFSGGLVLILSLGIGVTAAIFSLVRGVLWEPLPVPRPAELHLAVDASGEPSLLSAPTIRRLEMDTALQGSVIAYSYLTSLAARIANAPAERLDAQFVSDRFFHAFQLAAARGRLLSPGDDETGAPRSVAVASWAWWKQKLGGDPGAVGRVIHLNGQPVTIVGIAPAAFTGPSLGSDADLWLPTGLQGFLHTRPSAMTVSDGEPPGLEHWMSDDRVAWLHAMVRLPAAAVSAQGALEAAWQPQLSTVLGLIGDPVVHARIRQNAPRWTPSPQGYSDTRREFRSVGLTLSLLVAAVVVATVANTSTLLLLRLLSRGREIGVRLALGAGRWRLARGFLMEGVLLSLVGAAAGLLLGVWLTPLLAGWLVPNAADGLPGVDGPLVVALAGLAVLLGLLLGAAPAWLCAHLAPQAILQQRTGGPGGSLRLGRALIVLQLALSVLLVSVAAALALDVQRVLRTDPGYARESVLSTSFDLTAAGIAPENQPAVLAHLRQAAESLPQVRGVGFAANGVLSGSRSNSGVYFRGEGVRQPTGHVQHEGIDEQYFDAMGMTLLRGRHFAANDTAGRPPVAIISQRLARQVFGDADPLGRRFGFDETADAAEDFEIIGVAGDARINTVREAPAALFYTSLAQRNTEAHCLVVRLAGNAAAAREQLRKTITAAEPGVMFTRWMTLDERARQWLRNDLATVRLTAGFGLLAMLLAGIGVFAALGYLVSHRSREIAVRLAIGADPARVWRGIVREALVLGLVGATLGFVLAAALPHWLSSWLMTGLRIDWTAIALATLAGVAAAVLGGLVPARHAAKVDPLALLRSQ